MREFVYNEEVLAAGKNEMTKLVTDKKKQFVSASRLLILYPSDLLFRRRVLWSAGLRSTSVSASVLGSTSRPSESLLNQCSGELVNNHYKHNIGDKECKCVCTVMN